MKNPASMQFVESCRADALADAKAEIVKLRAENAALKSRPVAAANNEDDEESAAAKDFAFRVTNAANKVHGRRLISREDFDAQ
jgi:hypothetical protein